MVTSSHVAKPLPSCLSRKRFAVLPRKKFPALRILEIGDRSLHRTAKPSQAKMQASVRKSHLVWVVSGPAQGESRYTLCMSGVSPRVPAVPQDHRHCSSALVPPCLSSSRLLSRKEHLLWQLGTLSSHIWPWILNITLRLNDSSRICLTCSTTSSLHGTDGGPGLFYPLAFSAQCSPAGPHGPSLATTTENEKHSFRRTDVWSKWTDITASQWYTNASFASAYVQ